MGNTVSSVIKWSLISIESTIYRRNKTRFTNVHTQSHSFNFKSDLTIENDSGAVMSNNTLCRE